MKYCYVCKQDRPIENFGKNQSKKDGLSTECRGCKRKIDKEYHAANRNERCKKMRAYWNNNLEHCQEKGRVYSRSEIGRENNNQATRKYKEENPEKIHAQLILRYAVRSGKIDKPSCCETCSSTDLVQGHHVNYSKPLEVQWVCQKCHRELHMKGDIYEVLHVARDSRPGRR